jgi:hypothetical protein
MFYKIGDPAGHDVQQAKFAFQGLMRCARMSGDHAQQFAGAGDQRLGLHRMNARPKVFRLIFGSGHPIALLYIHGTKAPVCAGAFFLSSKASAPDDLG